jgi:hypothetical protein
MTPIILLAAAALLATAPTALAQEQSDQPQVQQADPASSPPPVRYAVPRSQAPARAPGPQRAAPPQRAEPAVRYGRPRLDPAPAPQPEPRAQRAAPPAPSPGVTSAERGDEAQRRAVPRGSRPREDNPPIGVAVPRDRPVASPVDRGGPRVTNRGGYTRPSVYNNYYYYPRRSHPYGYGAFGLGYFYYDPYRWHPRGYSVYAGPGSGYYGGGYYGSGYYGSGPYRRGFSSFDLGELRLRVSPRHAQVFIDGYYAGIVDDFDGIIQSMKLEEGPYRIEIVAPGYEPLQFDVRILPGQKITYRGDLIRQRP